MFQICPVCDMQQDIEPYDVCQVCGHEWTSEEIRSSTIAPIERPLTKYAPDVASATSAEPDSGLESVPAVESDTQPRG